MAVSVPVACGFTVTVMVAEAALPRVPIVQFTVGALIVHEPCELRQVGGRRQVGELVRPPRVPLGLGEPESRTWTGRDAVRRPSGPLNRDDEDFVVTQKARAHSPRPLHCVRNTAQ